MRCIITHLDTCLPDYFQGSSHFIVAVPVNELTTVRDVISSIKSDPDSGPTDWSEEQCLAFDTAVREMDESIPKDKQEKPFAPQIEPCDDENAPSIYAYIEIKFEQD